MLSRVADALYWTSRYLERAEHTSRLVDVHLHSMLDLSSGSNSRRWERLLQVLQFPREALPDLEPHTVTQTLTFEHTNRDSVVACISAARENARQVREQISTEMWEQLNQLYLSVIRTGIDQIWHARPHEFFWSVREGSHLFQGITDATMNHGQGWQFIQLGRFIERANITAALLGGFLADLHKDHQHSVLGDGYLEWVGLLKCCTAFEAFCKVYTADLHPAQVAEFLLLNPEFPRSIHFAAKSIVSSLDAIADAADSAKSGRANRAAGRLLAVLAYSQIDEIMAGGLQPYLDDIQSLCTQIHAAIQETYIHYPVESALPS